MKPRSHEPFLREVVLLRERVTSWDAYPFSIPAVRSLDTLALDPKVTFLVGENGSGKSTLMEALALTVGLGPEGGSQNMRFSTRPSESSLHEVLRVIRGARRPRTSFFLRAESFFNVASRVDDLGLAASYGGKSLHEQSHGESFLALVNERFGEDGLYLMDEPEAALSPQRQLALLAAFDRLVRKDRSQLVVATHSPILLAYPEARIYSLDERGIAKVSYEETEHYALTRDFLLNRERYLRRLSGDQGD
ncbi:MAG TPA: AAA family ATPase [Anaeromyxobacteraceae bacterium]|nr:AAA family ATPase [Anaeromyxobacteraceae bacterium]